MRRGDAGAIAKAAAKEMANVKALVGNSLPWLLQQVCL
jgi:hypothetical protein